MTPPDRLRKHFSLTSTGCPTADFLRESNSLLSHRLAVIFGNLPYLGFSGALNPAHRQFNTSFRVFILYQNLGILYIVSLSLGLFIGRNSPPDKSGVKKATLKIERYWQCPLAVASIIMFKDPFSLLNIS